MLFVYTDTEEIYIRREVILCDASMNQYRVGALSFAVEYINHWGTQDKMLIGTRYLDLNGIGFVQHFHEFQLDVTKLYFGYLSVSYLDLGR